MFTADIDAPTGGLQAQSLRLMKGFASLGIAAAVCTRNYHHLARNEERDGIKIHRSPVLNRSARVLNSGGYLLDAVAWLLRNRAAYDVIHSQQMFGPATAGLLAKRMTGKPVVVRVSSMGELGEVAELHRMGLSTARIRQLQNVDRWIALTRAMRSEIMSLGIPAERISVIANSAEIPNSCAFDLTTRMRYRKQLGLKYERIVTFSGRLSSEKNLDTLLDAWPQIRARIPSAHLLLLGAGGDFRNVESSLRAQQTRLGLEDSVHFLGHVPNVGEFLLASDVFVLPTSTEGMSNSLIEAMAAGCAIVTTEIEANCEVVGDADAQLVPPRDVEALTNAAIAVLSDSRLAIRLGENARRTAERNHTPAYMVDRYLDAYQEALATRMS